MISTTLLNKFSNPNITAEQVIALMDEVAEERKTEPKIMAVSESYWNWMKKNIADLPTEQFLGCNVVRTADNIIIHKTPMLPHKQCSGKWLHGLLPGFGGMEITSEKEAF